ncbi:hypothetical protein GCM10022198_08280 [Klugiella xanthotipulae]
MLIDLDKPELGGGEKRLTRGGLTDLEDAHRERAAIFPGASPEALALRLNDNNPKSGGPVSVGR